MRVFELRADHSKYQSVRIDLERYPYERLCLPYAKPMASSWHPIRIEMEHRDGRKKLVPSDYPGLLPEVPVFSRRAVDSLHDILVDNGEILPLDCDEGEYFLYNVTRLIDALDLERCEVERFQCSGRLSRILSHAFKPELVREAVIFKIPTFESSDVFVTDRFLARVEQTGLIGFDFRPLWSSARGFSRG